MERALKELFGARITELRKKHGWTQQRLADIMGLKLIGISQIERGKKFTSEKNIQKFCEVFNCTPKDLFSFEAKLTAHEDAMLEDIQNLLEKHPELVKDTVDYIRTRAKNSKI